MKSQLGHWIQGGEKIFKWGKICRISKEPDLSRCCDCVDQCVRLGHCLTRSAFWDLPFLKVIIMSLKFPRHYSHFLFDLVFEEVSVSLCFQACCLPCVCPGFLPVQSLVVWMQVGWGGDPRERVRATERSSSQKGGCLLVLTLLCCDSDSHLSSFSEA